jgi:hypothetical protein
MVMLRISSKPGLAEVGFAGGGIIIGLLTPPAKSLGSSLAAQGGQDDHRKTRIFEILSSEQTALNR